MTQDDAREVLIDLLSRITATVPTTGPLKGLVLADSMADALIDGLAVEGYAIQRSQFFIESVPEGDLGPPCNACGGKSQFRVIASAWCWPCRFAATNRDQAAVPALVSTADKGSSDLSAPASTLVSGDQP